MAKGKKVVVKKAAKPEMNMDMKKGTMKKKGKC